MQRYNRYEQVREDQEKHSAGGLEETTSFAKKSHHVTVLVDDEEYLDDQLEQIRTMVLGNSSPFMPDFVGQGSGHSTHEKAD